MTLLVTFLLNSFWQIAIDGAPLTFAVQTRDLFGASSSRNVVLPLHQK